MAGQLVTCRGTGCGSRSAAVKTVEVFISNVGVPAGEELGLTQLFGGN
jgi:hypothetical protein